MKELVRAGHLEDTSDDELKQRKPTHLHPAICRVFISSRTIHSGTCKCGEGYILLSRD
jgi:hypothetical protein